MRKNIKNIISIILLLIIVIAATFNSKQNNVQLRDIGVKVTQLNEPVLGKGHASYVELNQELIFRWTDIVFDGTYRGREHYAINYNYYDRFFVEGESEYAYKVATEYYTTYIFIVNDVIYGDKSWIGQEIRIGATDMDTFIDSSKIILEANNHYILMARSMYHPASDMNQHWVPDEYGPCRICLSMNCDFAADFLGDVFAIDGNDIFVRSEAISYKDGDELWPKFAEASEITQQWLTDNKINYKDLEIVTDLTEGQKFEYVKLDKKIFMDFLVKIVNCYN